MNGNCSVQALCSFFPLCTINQNGTNIFPCEYKFIKKGTLIWFNKPEFQDYYVIKSGITVAFNYLEEGRESVYGILGKGQWLGISNLFSTYKRTYVVQALTDIEVGKMNEAVLLTLNKIYPEIQNYFYVTTFNGFEAVIQYMEAVSEKRLYEKVKNVLLLLVSLDGRINGVGEEHKFTLTHKDLARLTCSDRVSITRVMHRLKDEGWVQLGRGEFSLTIPDEEVIREGHPRFVTPDGELRNRTLQYFGIS